LKKKFGCSKIQIVNLLNRIITSNKDNKNPTTSKLNEG